MRRRGWFRLWIVITAIFVPAMAVWMEIDDQATWNQIEHPVVSMCVDQELNLPTHPDGLKCIHQHGADQTIFQEEHITPAAYWARALGIAFVLDVLVTGLLLGIFVVARWVARGFRADANTAS
jgi:hypothetical protein